MLLVIKEVYGSKLSGILIRNLLRDMIFRVFEGLEMSFVI